MDNLTEYSKISKKIKKSIVKPPKTSKWIGFVNINSLEGYAYVIYDANKKLCEIINIHGSNLKKVTAVLQISTIIPDDVTIFSSIPIYSSTIIEDIKMYVDAGFRDPYIRNNTSLCISKKNMIQDTQEDIVAQIKYVLTQFLLFNDTPICTTILCLTKDAIKYLKSLTATGKTKNSDGSITQKEIAGGLYVSSTTPDIIHMLDILENSIIIGSEEGVNIVPAMYNFHSHPKEAYINHNVPLAWPSQQDYIGFLRAVEDDKTICHLVISIEGIYIISLSPQWFDNPLPLSKDFGTFIQDNYTFPCKNDQQINEYLMYINNIKYDNKSPLIEVQYKSWSDADTPFTIVFGREDSNCASS
jgi:hypothetical protein